MPKQRVAVEIYYDGAWHDLVATDDVLDDTPIVIMRGDGDESAAPRPSSIILRLANDDDMYRTSNPESPLYGKAGVNTPLRVLLDDEGRGIGEISSWKAGQTSDFRRYPRRGKAWVDIEANGLFQRINQWTDVVESTMIKGIRSLDDYLVGAWPLEDKSTSTILTNIAAGGPPGAFTGDTTLGDEDERPAGSARSVKLGSAGTRIIGTFVESTASGWQISFAVKLAALPASGTYGEIFYWTDSVGRRWTWEANNANWAWSIIAADGTLIAGSASAYTGASPDGWVRCRMKCTVSGGTVTYEPAWYREGDDSLFGVTGNFAGTSTGSLRFWTALSATGFNAGAWYTSVFAIDNTSVSMFSSAIISGFNGHAGERAGDRFDRLLTDLDIDHDSNGDPDLTVQMGGQPADKAMEILREIRDTDDAVFYESKDTLSIIATWRNYRYNQTPALALNVDDRPSGFPTLPVEVSDDLPIHNIVTAANRAGGEVTVEDSTSPMGSAPPPIGRGEYRQTVDVNVYDPEVDLPLQAGWWLRRGTVDLPRFPQVVVNLAALGPTKIAEVEGVTIGSVITITGYRENLIRLHVIGYTEVIGQTSRSIAFTCRPDQQFDVGTYNDGVKRYDLATSTMSATAAPTVTTLTLGQTADERWSTTSAYDLFIAGELVGVPAGGMGARTGSAGAYQQILTGAVRSKNGVRKTLPAGASVRVATPGRNAL